MASDWTADAARWPRLGAAAAYLRETWAILHGALDSLERLAPEDWDRCERTLALLEPVFPDPAARRAALDALADYTIRYLREQVSYGKTGAYSRSSFEEAAQAVYLDADLMRTMYLPGLYLTQAFWPVHVRIGAIFDAEFLARVPDRGTLVEVGTGHGWTFARVLIERPGVRSTGYDYSPSALEFTRCLLTANGVAAGRYDLRQADVQKGLDFASGEADFVVSGEVLEHIERPEIAAAEFRRVLRRGGVAFVTTALDSPALDHISNWPDAEVVDDLLRAAGFDIERRFVLRPADFTVRKTRFVDTTKNYAAVLRAR